VIFMAAYTAPTAAETDMRLAQVTNARDFVLTRTGVDGGLVYDGSAVDQTGSVVAITGDAAWVLREMFATYPTAGSNPTTTAVQSAINLTRRFFRAMGKNCNTQGAQEGSFGAAFGLAMVYFHGAMQPAGAEEAPAG
jgi:hypothetical protein